MNDRFANNQAGRDRIPVPLCLVDDSAQPSTFDATVFQSGLAMKPKNTGEYNNDKTTCRYYPCCVTLEL
jgi:hypothetical protein